MDYDSTYIQHTHALSLRARLRVVFCFHPARYIEILRAVVISFAVCAHTMLVEKLGL